MTGLPQRFRGPAGRLWQGRPAAVARPCCGPVAVSLLIQK